MNMARTGVVVERSGDQASVRAIELPPADPSEGDAQLELVAAEVLPLDVQITQGTNARAVFPVRAGQSAVARRPGTGELVYVQGGPQGMGISRPGTFASSFRAPASTVVPLAAGMDPLAAAAGMSSAVSARLALFETGGYQPGDIVLVLGASGAVGLAALQLARANGSTVVGVSRDPGALAEIAGDAVAGVILCTPAQMGPAVSDATGGIGADVVVDCLGGDVLSAALNAGAPGCRHVVVGYLAGLEPTISIGALLARRSTIAGFNVHMASVESRDAATRAALGDLADGTIQMPPARTFPLSQVADAYAQVGGRQRVLLVPDAAAPPACPPAGRPRGVGAADLSPRGLVGLPTEAQAKLEKSQVRIFSGTNRISWGLGRDRT